MEGEMVFKYLYCKFGYRVDLIKGWIYPKSVVPLLETETYRERAKESGREREQEV